MSKSKQSSVTTKLKPEGFWSDVLSERVRLTIKTTSAMQVNGIAMKLNTHAETATIVQHTRTAVYIDYLCGSGKRRQRALACLGVLLPFSHQQMAVDLILDPGTEVTLSVKGPHEVTVLGRFLSTDSQHAAGTAVSHTLFTRSFHNSGTTTSKDHGSGPSNPGKDAISSNSSKPQNRTRSSSRAASTASTDLHSTDRAFSPALHARGQSYDSVSTSTASYHDANDLEDQSGSRHWPENYGSGSGSGPADKKPRRT